MMLRQRTAASTNSVCQIAESLTDRGQVPISRLSYIHSDAPRCRERNVWHANRTRSLHLLIRVNAKESVYLPSARSRASNRAVSTKSPLKVSGRVPPVHTQYSRESCGHVGWCCFLRVDGYANRRGKCLSSQIRCKLVRFLGRESLYLDKTHTECDGSWSLDR